jgi:hypothetical protein
MTRAQKILILQKIAAGEAPTAAIHGPQMAPIFFEVEPGKYAIDLTNSPQTYSKTEIDTIISERQTINDLFPDWPKMPAVIFVFSKD